MDVYTNQDTIPLSYSQSVNSVLTTGLTVHVVVKNASTGATLLASTVVPEVSAPSGIYTYNWTHGLTANTECVVNYAVTGGMTRTEYILISFSSGSRAV